jgi:hypothetical protein
MEEIKYPEITKKTSTPINPPGNHAGNAWKATTIKTATARSPSISERYCKECAGFMEGADLDTKADYIEIRLNVFVLFIQAKPILNAVTTHRGS